MIHTTYKSFLKDLSLYETESNLVPYKLTGFNSDENDVFFTKFTTSAGDNYTVSFSRDFEIEDDFFNNDNLETKYNIKQSEIADFLSELDHLRAMNKTSEKDFKMYDVFFETDSGLALTNKGDAYRVLATVAEAIRQYSEFFRNTLLLGFIYGGHHEKNENKNEEAKRTKIFRHLINKKLANFKYVNFFNGSILYRIKN